MDPAAPQTLAALATRDDGLGKRARALELALANGRLGHAYLIYGATGAGKRDLACALATALLGAGRALAAQPDLLLLEPLEGKREIGIDAVREAVATLALSPLEAKGRVLLVAGADLLSEEAANALLKTLEEPPEGALIVLLTSRPEAVLPTIRSRALGLRLPPRAAPERPGELRAAAEAILLEGADPFDGAGRAIAAVAAIAAEGEDGSALERKRHAALALLDEAVAVSAERFRGRARAGAPIGRDAIAIERLEIAAEHIEANATPELVLEALALDLAEGKLAPRVPAR